MTNKSITLELPEWANWVSQNPDGRIVEFECEPTPGELYFLREFGNKQMVYFGESNENWRDSKINLNTHGAYIDADGILRKCELVTGMLSGKS